MPALGMAQETGKVLRWLKGEGDSVAKGEPLLEVETDKVTVEIEAPGDGILSSISAPDGAEVPVGTVIAVVLGANEEASTRRLASPKARRLAAAQGVDLASLAGTGPGGAVVAADLAAVTPAASELGTVWRRMAEHTTRSWQEVPHFSLARDVDATGLIAARQRSEGAGFTDLLVRLCAESLVRHPRVNARWANGSVVPSSVVNVGVAVATDDGLVVPVVHDAATLSLAAISERVREIALAARENRLRLEDIADGTFTISNLGMYGVDAFEAIVNAPQAAILAVGRIVERPMVHNGELAARPGMTLTVSFDHRVVDGARGAEFLQTLASLVEDPGEVLD
jgi:pyruvate dehydrogenase E2 component (dihydrolipoamide acetyltransferase)